MRRLSPLPSLSAASLAWCLCTTQAAADDGAWQTVFTGYFRAPLAVGFANRADPGSNSGKSSLQLSYAPDHTVDGPYAYPNYSYGNFTGFAFTRLQETDWAEVFAHEQKEHVDTAVGWGGYWYQAIGFQKPFASWAPAYAWSRIDGDFKAFGVQSNIALQLGAFWPKFGYFPVYDTYTMGRFHQIGERLDLTIPINPDLKVTLTNGIGGDRNGFTSVSSVPIVGVTSGTTTALALLTYFNLAVDYKDSVHVGLHWNNSWTTDPGNSAGLPIGASFRNVRDAHITVSAAELKLNHPRLGSLWVSPTYVQVRNGWALDTQGGGIEVLHSQGGGFAGNYMGWTGTLSNSTGSGTTFGLGFLYENTLSGVAWGSEFATRLPDLRLQAFGLMATSTRDLAGTTNSNLQKNLDQFKGGAALTLQVLNWLGVMLRFDQVYEANPQFRDVGLRGNSFSILTPRLIFQSSVVSNEVLYLQYSKYILGDAYHSTASEALYQGVPVQDVIKAEAMMAW